MVECSVRHADHAVVVVIGFELPPRLPRADFARLRMGFRFDRKRHGASHNPPEQDRSCVLGSKVPGSFASSETLPMRSTSRITSVRRATSLSTVVVLFLNLPSALCQLSRLRTIRLFDPGSRGFYDAAVADFGDPILKPVHVNFMFPPGDPFLCSFPDSLDPAFAPKNNTTPIALMVRRYRCSPQTKAEVVKQIQNFTNGLVQYMVVYSDDPQDGNALYRLQPHSDSTQEDIDALSSIGILYVAYRTAAGMVSITQQRAQELQANPFLYQDGSEEWFLPGHIDEYPTRLLTQTTRDSMYWFRFVLFTLLILSPCLRAGYLWWSGGGRLHWRRNENGRITGIQYIPYVSIGDCDMECWPFSPALLHSPMPYWLTAGRIFNTGAEQNPTRGVLTAEQFDQLPEIAYKTVDGATVTDDGESDPNPSEEQVPKTESEETGDEEVVDEKDETASKAEEPEEVSISKEESADEATDEEEADIVVDLEEGIQAELTTTCTMCSICIDDFEEDEKLVLLPRCRHAFHRECLQPWLMERQGCCPLCKRGVIEDVEDEESESEEQYRGGHVEPPDSLQPREDEEAAPAQPQLRHTAFSFQGLRIY